MTLKKTKRMKNFKIILAFLCINVAFAQYDTKAQLAEVKQDGLHEICLPNAIRSFSNNDLSDFRILDSKGIEVPYFIRKKEDIIRTSAYVDFDILSKKRVRDTSSTIIFKNNFKTINAFDLFVANYSGSKSFKLSGSNNKKEWFGILNKGVLSNLESVNDISTTKTIRFPRCNYRFIKITFNDKKSLPINVLKIGSISNDSEYKKFQTVTSSTQTISELSEVKKTQIHVHFKNKEIINQVQFKVVSPEFYNRNVVIYTKSTRVVKQKSETYNKTLARFKLNSENETIFNIPEIFEDDIYIEIENKDSQKLVFSDILFFQKPLYIITSLKKNETYTIKTGLKNSKAPEYDLSFFRNSISKSLPTVQIINIVKESPKEVIERVSIWQKPWFMWTCIGVAGLVILFFMSNLVKDLKKDS